MTDEERLRWLEVNQPRNTCAINALRKRLKLELLSPWDWVGKSSKNWKNRGSSSN